MQSKFILCLAAILTHALLLAGNSFAYQEIDVKNGGTVQGKAVLIGEPPEPRAYHLVLFPNREICSDLDTDEESNRILNDFVADGSGGLKDVVISIDHVEAGKPFVSKPIEILSQKCEFQPIVNTFRQDQEFLVDNRDAVMHNSQVYMSERGKIALNIPIPAVEISKGVFQFQKDYKIMQMICGMHEFMQTWGFRVQNPYNAVTKEDGAFTIDNLPPGDYVLNAWHYLMKVQSRKIHVEEGKVVNVNFEFKGAEVVRPLYETIKSGRIKKEAKSRK